MPRVTMGKKYSVPVLLDLGVTQTPIRTTSELDLRLARPRDHPTSDSHDLGVAQPLRCLTSELPDL